MLDTAPILTRPLFLLMRDPVPSKYEQGDQGVKRRAELKTWSQSEEFRTVADFIEREGTELLGDKPAIIAWLDTFPMELFTAGETSYVSKALQLAIVPNDQRAFFDANLAELKKRCHNYTRPNYNDQRMHAAVPMASLCGEFTPVGGIQDSHQLVMIERLEKPSEIPTTDSDILLAIKIATIAEECGHAFDAFNTRKVQIANSPEGYSTEALAKTYAFLRTLQYFQQKGLKSSRIKQIAEALIKEETMRQIYNCEWTDTNQKYPHISLPVLVHFWKDGQKALDMYLSDRSFAARSAQDLFHEAIILTERYMPPQTQLYKELEFMVEARKKASEEKKQIAAEVSEFTRGHHIETDGYQVSPRNFFRDNLAAISESKLSGSQRLVRDLALDSLKAFCTSLLPGSLSVYTEMIRSAKRAALQGDDRKTR